MLNISFFCITLKRFPVLCASCCYVFSWKSIWLKHISFFLLWQPLIEFKIFVSVGYNCVKLKSAFDWNVLFFVVVVATGNWQLATFKLNRKVCFFFNSLHPFQRFGGKLLQKRDCISTFALISIWGMRSLTSFFILLLINIFIHWSVVTIYRIKQQ